jgi:hypothetical protein
MTLLTDNMGCIDRLARTVLGFLSLNYVFVPPGHLWALAALLPLLTGLLGTCPVYRLVGVSTSRRPR